MKYYILLNNINKISDVLNATNLRMILFTENNENIIKDYSISEKSDLGNNKYQVIIEEYVDMPFLQQLLDLEAKQDNDTDAIWMVLNGQDITIKFKVRKVYWDSRLGMKAEAAPKSI